MPRLRPSDPPLAHPTREPSLMHVLPVSATDRSVPLDVRMARVAARQASLVTRGQLYALGLGRGAIEHRRATGRLHRVHRGVFLVGAPPLPPLGREVAALLACGADATLSFGSALACWGLARTTPRAVHVTIPGLNRLRHPGIVVHTSTCMPPSDVRRHLGLPITGPGRTIIDVASSLAARDVRWLVEEALVRRLLTLEELAATVDRHPRRRGAGRVRRVVDEDLAQPRRTRSEAERRLLDLIRTAALPEPQVNARVAGFEVDLHWPDARVVVEVDGFGFHASRAAFERDRRRDAELQARGWRVVRLTWRRIHGEPEATVALLRRTLASASRH